MGKNKGKKRAAANAPETSPEEIMLQRAKQWLLPADFSALTAELEQPLRGAFRINPLKIQQPAQQYASQLAEKYGWTIEPVPYCANGWWVEDEGSPVGQTWEHRLGNYYVQDASSMLPVELFDFDAGPAHPVILDMAASPGGKTNHIISKTIDHGFVLANDASKDRITALRLVLQTWGSINHAITQFPGEKFGNWYPETFDYILLDAPCSMQNLRSTEARPMRAISDREEQSLAQRQKKLLESALRAAKIGGQIVYATCTLMPEEDEAVIDWLLQQYPDSVQVDDMQTRLPQPAPALTKVEDSIFHPDVVNAIRIWPHRIRSSGFFTVRLTKLHGITARVAAPPQFDITRTDFQPLDKSLTHSLADYFSDNFGLSLDQILFENKLSLWQYKQQVLAFPQDYFHHFNNLPIRSLGLPVAQHIGDSWLPDHQWVSRFFPDFLPNAELCPQACRAAWINGEDISIDCSKRHAGDTIIFKEEANEFLGIGKKQDDRIKNLLPKRMVL